MFKLREASTPTALITMRTVTHTKKNAVARHVLLAATMETRAHGKIAIFVSPIANMGWGEKKIELLAFF